MKNSNSSSAKYIDLHLHLDGAITLDIAKKLAEIQNITLPTQNDAELSKLLTAPENCSSLNEFLNCFKIPKMLLQTKTGISECVHLVADNIKSQGVIYAEIRFAPQLHTFNGLSQEEVILAALDGLKKTDLKTNLILCFIRGNDNDKENEETLELAKKYLVKDGGVVAVDLAGAEALFPTSKYKKLFEKVASYKLPYTIHAGEADGPESVKNAISFGTKRIGHGVRIANNPEVIDLIKKNGITLEMCPTSNKQTHAVDDMTKYPLADFLNQGIKVTINTDDMGIEGTTIVNEFNYMEKLFNLSEEQKKTLLRNAIDAAFTSDEVKSNLKAAIFS